MSPSVPLSPAVPVVALLAVLTGVLRSASAEDLRAQAGVEAGLCVAVGVDDMALLSGLARDGRILVRALHADAAVVDRLRGAVPADLRGLVSVQRLADPRVLPFRSRVSNLTLVKAEGAGGAAPDEVELRRVTAPLGAIARQQAGRWTVTPVPMPPELDGWTHFDHGPDGNPVSQDTTLRPPNALQWHAGPIHSSGGRLPGPLMRISGGLVAYSGQVAPYHAFHVMSGIATERTELAVRDAFNGLPRWHRWAEGPNREEVGVLDGNELFHAPNQRAGEPLARIDARSGAVLRTYDQGLVYGGVATTQGKPKGGGVAPRNPNAAIWQRVVGGTVVQVSHRRVVVLDRASGAVRWQKRFDEGPPITFALTDTAGTQLFLARGVDEDISAPVKGLLTGVDLSHIEAFDLAKGEARWTNTTLKPEQKARTTRLIYYDGTLYVPYSDEPQMSYVGQRWRFLAIDGKSGRNVWHQDQYVSVGGTPSGKHHPLAFGDLLALVERNVRLYDRRTGEARGNAGVNIFGTSGCTTGRGSVAGYLINGPIMVPVNGLELGKPEVPLAFRADCELGVFPAYGMLYTPSGGYHSHNFYSGVSAWSHTVAADDPPVPDAQRLERGPAFGTAGPPGTGGWPVYRADERRRSFTPEPIGTTLAIAWTRPLDPPAPDGPIPAEWSRYPYAIGRLSAATAQGSAVYVSVPERHQVVRVESASGTVRWTATLDGRVNGPPTLHGGLLYVGDRAGWVTCLHPESGAVVWRSLAAPARTQIVAGGQVESVWPVEASPVVWKGALVVSAGRHTTHEGGLRLWGLDPLTGAVRWQTTVDARGPVIEANARTKDFDRGHFMHHNQIPVSDGTRLHLGRLRLADDYAAGKPFEFVEIGVKDQRHIQPNWAGFLQRQEQIRNFQVSEDYGECLRYHEESGRRVALSDGLAVYSGFPRAHVRGGGFWDAGGLRVLHLSADGTVSPPTFKRGDPLPAGTAWEISSTVAPPAGRQVPPPSTALAIAGETVVLVGQDKTLRLYGLTDGVERGTLALPDVTVRDGIAIAGGQIYLSLQNGALVAVSTR